MNKIQNKRPKGQNIAAVHEEKKQLKARELNNGQVTAEMNIKYIFKQIKTQHN